jgi:hypothetical protein
MDGHPSAHGGRRRTRSDADHAPDVGELVREHAFDLTLRRGSHPDGAWMTGWRRTADTIKKILSAMGLPTEAPKLCPARPPPAESGGEGGDWLT